MNRLKKSTGGCCPPPTCSARFVVAYGGEVIVNYGWVVATGPRVVALEYNLRTKRAQVAGSSSGSPPGVILSGENALHIDETKKGEMTHIEFPEYVGWRVHSAEVARYTLSVCLILPNTEHTDASNETRT